MAITPQKIALDSMVFIYHFEQVEAYFPKTHQILSQAQSGKTKIITSIISVLESLSAPKYLNLPHVVDEITLFFKEAPYISVLDVNPEIALEAAKLRRENKSLRTPDSIQIATALVHHAETFITNDDRLKNLSFPSLKILPITQL